MSEMNTFDYINKDLRGYSFRGRNLSGVNFSNSDISGCDFSNTILIEASFNNVEVGIDWSKFIYLTIASVCFAGFFLGLLGYSVDFNKSSLGEDSPNEYLNSIRGLLVLLFLEVIFTIRIVDFHGNLQFIFDFIDFTPANNILICYIGFLSCFGITIYIIINIIKKFNSFFRTTFRNADLTGAILNKSIIQNADLTGAILDNVTIEESDTT